MAAGARQSQIEGRRRRFYERVARAAAACGYTMLPRERGGEQIVLDGSGNKFMFGMTTGNASNGETFGKFYVDVMPHLSSAPAGYFNSWSWIGSPGNKLLSDFWRELFRDPARMDLQAVAKAYRTDMGIDITP